MDLLETDGPSYRDSTAERPGVSLGGRIALSAAVALGFAVVDLLWDPLTSLAPWWVLVFLSPILSATVGVQTDLFALGAALGPGRMVIRLPAAGLALAATFVLVTTGSFLRAEPMGVAGPDALSAANLAVSWLASFLALLAFRVVTRRRLVLRGGDGGCSSQFRLAHLSIGLTLIGVTFALLNIYGLPGDLGRVWYGTLLWHWGAMVVTSQVLTLAALRAAFLWTGVWRLRMLELAGLGVAVAGVQIFVTQWAYGDLMPISFSGYVVSTLHSVSHCFGSLVAFSLVRFAGYELRQVDGRPAPMTTKAKAVVVEADPWTEEED